MGCLEGMTLFDGWCQGAWERMNAEAREGTRCMVAKITY